MNSDITTVVSSSPSSAAPPPPIPLVEQEDTEYGMPEMTADEQLAMLILEEKIMRKQERILSEQLYKLKIEEVTLRRIIYNQKLKGCGSLQSQQSGSTVPGAQTLPFNIPQGSQPSPPPSLPSQGGSTEDVNSNSKWGESVSSSSSGSGGGNNSTFGSQSSSNAGSQSLYDSMYF